jgi:hypothetical protein
MYDLAHRKDVLQAHERRADQGVQTEEREPGRQGTQQERGRKRGRAVSARCEGVYIGRIWG